MIRYIWGKKSLRKVDDKDLDILHSDLHGKPEIPFLSVFGKLHAKFLKRRNNGNQPRPGK